MKWMVVTHKVEDYNRWKPYFDEDKPAQKAGGTQGGLLMRNLDDPDEIVIGWQIADEAKSREFVSDPRLAEVMKLAGVVGMPKIQFLEVIEELDG
jgi:hypothetical protein